VEQIFRGAQDLKGKKLSWSKHREQWKRLFDVTDNRYPQRPEILRIAKSYGLSLTAANATTTQFMRARAPALKKAKRINKKAQVSSKQRFALTSRAAGGFFKRVLVLLRPQCVYRSVHSKCAFPTSEELLYCDLARVEFEHGYTGKDRNPSDFFEQKGVWENPQFAHELGSAYNVCKYCNLQADKQGATRQQMCHYKDLVVARAAVP